MEILCIVVLDEISFRLVETAAGRAALGGDWFIGTWFFFHVV